MDIYTKEYRILSCDVDPMRRLRLSRLFTMLQEAAIAHTEALGAGRAKTLDKGYLWVVTLQQAKIARLPVYDEKIRLLSAPGETMHSIFPRYYRIEDAQGNELVNASALWTLMNMNTRAMVFPHQAGVSVPGAKPGWKTFFPAPPKLPTSGEETEFTVPYSYTDINGHMNNTKYIDLAEDLMPSELRGARAVEVSVEYTGEAKCGDRLLLSQSAEEGRFLMSGKTEKRLFRLGIIYNNRK